MKRDAKLGFLSSFRSALGMFVLTTTLAAAPAPKNNVPAAAPPDGSAIVALATIPNLPSLPNEACTVSSACREPGPSARNMVAFIDAERLSPANKLETGGNAKPLKWDSRLAQVARQHSEDMASRHYFSHVDPNGDTPVERVTRAGVSWRSVGENIARNYTVAAAEAAFMNEPRFQRNHRANILNPKFNCVGIGIAQGSDGMVYVTQEFAQEQ